MEVELNNGKIINVDLIICDKDGKQINLDKLSCDSLLSILQEATDEFQNLQMTIECILDLKNPSGKCYYNGELKNWVEHVQNITPTI